MSQSNSPWKVIEMNNFYTVTVYEKGAEVICMLHTLLGEQGFQKGCSFILLKMMAKRQPVKILFLRWNEQNNLDLNQFPPLV